MKLHRDPRLVEEIEKRSRALGEIKDLGPLIDQIKDARIVMLGESTHGTHEYYEWRRMISEWLIVKHGFRFIAVEGDWPSCQHLNSYVRGGPGSARSALENFRRWPTWMWANTEVIRLAEWLRSHNTRVGREMMAGFHGLDVYSFFESMHEVINKVEELNPFLARRVRERYGCFDPYNEDERSYARSLMEFPEGCVKEVLSNLEDLIKLRAEQETLFDLQQNARIVKNAENYYRTMFQGNEDSWNVRDRHMMETLDLLLDHYGPGAKGIVWAHNTHVGDARATDMAIHGLVNIGSLAREKHGEARVKLVGFGTHRGSVIASHAWDGPIQKLPVPEAREGSYEEAFHEAALRKRAGTLYMTFGDEPGDSLLAEYRGHRAIGVVYDPAHERWGNYVPTSLARRYDGFIFIDETRAIEPLIQGFDRRELPETWPTGT